MIHCLQKYEIIYCLPEHSRNYYFPLLLQSFTFKEKSKRISTAIGARDLRFTEYLC
jgi:hypothetical protein